MKRFQAFMGISKYTWEGLNLIEYIKGDIKNLLEYGTWEGWRIKTKSSPNLKKGREKETEGENPDSSNHQENIHPIQILSGEYSSYTNIIRRIFTLHKYYQENIHLTQISENIHPTQILSGEYSPYTNIIRRIFILHKYYQENIHPTLILSGDYSSYTNIIRRIFTIHKYYQENFPPAQILSGEY